MLRNYFKLALKVLARNKFFTGISLFGISFTLLVLMLLTAMYDAELGGNAPLSANDRMLFLNSLRLEYERPDTTLTIDSTLSNGVMQYDTSMQIEPFVNSTSISGFGYYFLDRFLREAEGVERFTFFLPNNSFDLFLDNRKLTLEVFYTDADYWQVFDFPILAGQAISAGQVENGQQVAIITTKAAKSYFGTDEDVVGKEIRLGDQNFQVIGLTDHGRSGHPYVTADVYLPITTAVGDALTSTDYLGGARAAYLAKPGTNMGLLAEDLRQRAANAPLQNPAQYNRQSIEPMTFDEAYAHQIVMSETAKESYQQFWWAIVGLLTFFVVLPILNLINLNVSRVLERSAEIGVRKAFGAHQSTILYQFVFENVVLTLLGGLIGLVLTVVLIQVLNSAAVFRDVTLVFNFRVFIYSLLLCLSFGILSGLLPAWRVARLRIAAALKNNFR
ncbi:MAG: ABC transporter permease [Bacteroidota bacterium]